MPHPLLDFRMPSSLGCLSCFQYLVFIRIPGKGLSLLPRVGSLSVREKLLKVSTFGIDPGNSPRMLQIRLGSQHPLQEGGSGDTDLRTVCRTFAPADDHYAGLLCILRYTATYIVLSLRSMAAHPDRYVVDAYWMSAQKQLCSHAFRWV